MHASHNFTFMIFFGALYKLTLFLEIKKNLYCDKKKAL